MENNVEKNLSICKDICLAIFAKEYFLLSQLDKSIAALVIFSGLPEGSLLKKCLTAGHILLLTLWCILCWLSITG